MKACPNKNLPEWQALVDNDKIGEFEAMKDWMQYEDIRTPEEVLEKLYPVQIEDVVDENETFGLQKKEKDKYRTIQFSTKWAEKKDILNKFGIKIINTKYYYVLTKAQQDNVISYEKHPYTQPIGNTNKGFDFTNSIDGDIKYKIINGISYLFIDIKELVEEDGILIPQTVDYIKIPIDLVYFKGEKDYVNTINKNNEYDGPLDKNVKRFMFKTKNISLKKQVQYFTLKLINSFQKAMKDKSGIIMTYDEFKDLDDKQKAKIIKDLGLKDVVQEYLNSLKNHLDGLNAGQIREEAVEMFSTEFGNDAGENLNLFTEETKESIKKILDFLPDEFIKLLTFEYITNNNAYFKVIKANLPTNPILSSITDTLQMRTALAMNLALRNLKDAKLITNDQLISANNQILPEIKHYLKLISSDIKKYGPETAFKNTSTLRQQIIKKTKALKEINRFLINNHNTTFDEVWKQAILDIDALASTNNKGLFDLLQTMLPKNETIQNPQSIIALGHVKAELTTLTAAFAHELGHSLDYYLALTSAKDKTNLNLFITDLVKRPEFENYINKGLLTRGYEITHTHEIIPDVMAWVMGKATGLDMTKSHLSSLDDFFTLNEDLVNEIWGRHFKGYYKTVTKNNKLHNLSFLDYIKKLINKIIDFVNKRLKKPYFKHLNAEGVIETYSTDELHFSIGDMFNELKHVIFNSTNFDVETIVRSTNNPSIQSYNLKKSLLRDFKKLIKIASKEVSWQQRARINSDVASANTKLGTSFYVRFTQVGEADIYTWQIEDFKPAVEDDKIDPQLSLFYTEIINRPDISEMLEPDENAEPLSKDEKLNEKSNIQGLDQLDKIAAAMSKALTYPYEFITAQEAADLLVNMSNKNKYKGQPAFVFNGKIYFVSEKVKLNMLFHEFAHPFVKSIRLNNRKLFDNLFKELGQTPEGAAIIQFVRDEYSEDLSNNEDAIMEECITKGLETATMKIKHSSGFMNFIKNLMYAIKQAFRKVFGQKIKIEKLTPTTSLEELSRMLINNEKIDLRLTNDNTNIAQFITEDISPFLKGLTESTTPQKYELLKVELQRLLEKNAEIISKYHRELTSNKPISDDARNVFNSNFDKNMLDEMKDAVRPYTKTNLKLSTAQKDPNYVVKSASALINTLFNLRATTVNIEKYLTEISNSKDPISIDKVSFFETFLNEWERFLEEGTNFLSENRTESSTPNIGIPLDHPLEKLVDEIKKTIKTSQKKIQGIQQEGILTLITIALQPAMDNIDKKWKETQEELAKNNASPADIAKAKARYEGSKVTPEIIKASLTGKNGDSNVVQKLFEGYMYNNDPIIGGFASYLTDNIINAELKAMQKYNALITKLNPLLAQWGKRVKWQKGQMGLLLGFRNLVGGRDENGNFIKKDEWEMLHNFKNYNADLAELNFQISELAEKVRIDNLDADKTALTAKKRDLKTWQIEYMHQKLIPEYYKRLELLTKDDIGVALSEKIDDIFDLINSLVLPTSSEADILNSYDLSARLFRDYNRLASETDLKGNPKKGDELLIAQRMQEYKDQAKGMFDFIPKYRAFENAFEKYEQELITKYNLTQQGATMYKNSPEYNYAMDAWFLKNLRTVILDTFWQDRKVIQDEIKSILSKLPTDLALQTQLDELYKQQTDLTKGYKDQDGQIIATQMSPELLAKLKTIGENIDRIKDAIKFARSKEGGGPGIKLSKKDSKLLQKKMDELDALQVYEPTDYYIDTINEYLKDIESLKMMQLLKTTQITDVTLDLLLTNAPAMLELFDKSPEFKTWFDNNHSIKTKLVPTIKIDEETGEEIDAYKKEASYKRNYVWSRLRPRDDKYLEKYTFTKSNGDVMTVPGKPTTRYYTRVVKDEYYTGYDFKTGEINLIPNVHKNNKNQWLPRTDVSNKKYINERYIALKNSTNADDQVLFKILELLKEYHLDNQVGLEDNKKLYYSFPRFRKSFYEVLLTPGGVNNQLNQKMTKIGIIWQNIADFFRKAVDDYDVGVNPSDTWNLTNAEVNAELEYTDRDIPLIGLSGLEADLVSTDLMLSLHKYMYASQKNLTLKEMHPVARALKSVLENEKNKIRLTVAGKVDPDKDKKNVRLSTLQNLIDREFYGIRTVGVGSKNTFLQKVLTPFMFKRASFSFFSLNTVSAVKNTLGQKFQGLIEAASGKHYNVLEFFQAEGWASGAAMETFNAIYNPEQRSARLQMLDAFDVGEGRYENIIGTESSRSLLQDVVGLTWLTNFRRAIELQATYQQFAAMMKRQKVKQNGVDINYIDAWEIKDKKFQLKPGIDAEWGITYDSDGNQYIGTEFKNFRKSVQSVARDINGAYANFQQPEMSRYLLGRQVQFMRKFFVVPLMNRFGFKGNILNPIPRLNMGLNDTKESYHITTMQLVLRSIKNITKRMPYALKEEKQALAKVLTEVILLITMGMVLGPLFGYDPDDEKRFKKLRKKSGVMPFFGLVDKEQSEDFKLGGWMSNHALNMLIQVQAENGAWLKVSNYTSLLNISSIALGPTLTKYGEIWSNAIGSFEGDKKAEYQRDAGPYVWQQAHHAKVWNLLGSTLGITGTTKDPILHIKNTEGYQARK